MNPAILSELASLYAFSTLDDEDPAWVGELFDDSPDFQAAVDELQPVVAMLAYGVDPLPIPPDLKARLFQRIDQEDASASEIETLLAQANSSNWQPYAFGAGIEVATMHIDAETRQVSCFIRSFRQMTFPQHRHAGEEEIVVLDGDLKIGNQIYSKGDRIQSHSGTIHQPETLTGCVLFLQTSLDDEIL